MEEDFMKRYNEMTNEELNNLTDEQISILIDYECALEGIPLLPENPTTPATKDFQADIEVYEVKGNIFTNKEEALAVLGLLLSSNLVSSSYNNGSKRIVPLESYYKPELKIEKYFSEEMYVSIQEEKANYDRITKQYQDRKKEYDEAYKLRISIVKDITENIGYAQEQEHKKQKYTNEYKRYLKLSDNNKYIALNFLRNAHDEIDDIDGFVDSLKNIS